MNISVMDMIADWMKLQGLDKQIPTAYYIWKRANKAFLKGEFDEAKLYENMNHLLHNSSIPASVSIGDKVNFAYGGIGTIIHKDCIIDSYATIGSNVTLGGRGGSSVNYITEDGKRKYVPRIGEYSYISTGSKILGGVDVGPVSIVGANSVVLQHVEPLSVVIGSPAKVVNRINLSNYKKYRSTFSAFRGMDESEIEGIISTYDGK
ncbi:serine O-acetyltransferase [Aeromonas salmonicida]